MGTSPFQNLPNTPNPNTQVAVAHSTFLTVSALVICLQVAASPRVDDPKNYRQPIYFPDNAALRSKAEGSKVSELISVPLDQLKAGFWTLTCQNLSWVLWHKNQPSIVKAEGK